MKISTLISHTAELLKVIYKSSQPADKITSEYLRKKKYIGSKERKFISELLFHTLRNYYLFHDISYNIEKKISSNQHNKDKILNIFSIVSSIILYTEVYETQQNNLLYNINIPYAKVFKDEIDFLDYILNEFEITASAQDIFDIINSKFIQLNSSYASEENLKTRFSINNTFLNSLAKYLDNDSKIALLKSLCKSAPLTIRVNTSLIHINDVLDFFKKNSIGYTKTSLSPSGITVFQRINLNENPLYKQGLIDIQDEGSQLIGYAVNPNPNSRILDACAGAGGKSLHIADICSDNSEIIATDIDNRKLVELKRRAKKSKFNSIKTIHIHHKINPNKHYEFNKKFDYILVDAPCSGTGTVRRMPLPKYRINPNLIGRLQSNQLKILNQYAQFLKVGGILVYSTCSLMYEENQEVINKFLSTNKDFQPVPLLPDFEAFKIKFSELQENDFYINLLPSIHNTDGFFIAKFKRI